ncbi:MAG: type 11 methyltransferase [Methylocystaceae bacterium]|nr:MAG: type 11 methyltransferase [Methylocystaceae bacterium]
MAAPARKAALKKSRPCEACRDMKKSRMSALQENPFTGPLAAEYDVLRLMCPNAATLAKKIGI